MTVDERFSDDYLARRQDTALLGKRNPIITGPVSDWATDFSHLEPEWAADPYPILDDLRDRCPIAHTDRFGGGWLPTRYEDVAAIAYDTDAFSSRAIIMSNFRPPRDIAPIGGAPPISSDPPFHHDARKLPLPAFTKTAVSKLEPATRAFCHELIDAFEGKDVVLGIRPEDLEDAALSPDTPADHRLKGKVTLTEALGSEIMVHFAVEASQAATEEMRELAKDVGDERVIAPLQDGGTPTAAFVGRFGARSRVKIGDTVDVAVDSRALHFFDPETGLGIYDGTKGAT